MHILLQLYTPKPEGPSAKFKGEENRKNGPSQSAPASFSSKKGGERLFRSESIKGNLMPLKE